MPTTRATTRPLLLAAVLVAGPGLAGGTEAAEDGPPADMRELAHRQRYVQARFQRLCAQMKEVASALASTDPAAAAAVRRAVAEALKCDVADDMEQVVGHLDRGLAALARAGQTDVVADLRRVLKVLEDADGPPLGRLEGVLGKLKGLARDQHGLADRPPAADVDRPPTDAELDRRAGRQQAIAGRARDALGELKDAGESAPGPSAPGQKAVEDAVRAMDDAIGRLRRREPEKVRDDERDAARRLDDAVKELARFIRDERTGGTDRTVEGIDAELRRILKAQRELTGSTAAAHAARPPGGYDRRGLARLLLLSRGEADLARRVGNVAAAVRDEGTTAVFPSVLEEVRGDLADVAGRLAKRRAGHVTRAMQKAIEETLASLIDALASESRRRGERPGRPPAPPTDPGEGRPARPPLVSPVAELKMLRTLQEQVRRRTLALEASRRDGRVPPAELKLAHDALAGRQSRLLEMTRELRRKTAGPAR